MVEPLSVRGDEREGSHPRRLWAMPVRTLRQRFAHGTRTRFRESGGHPDGSFV